jgi:hypothetical protein
VSLHARELALKEAALQQLLQESEWAGQRGLRDREHQLEAAHFAELESILAALECSGAMASGGVGGGGGEDGGGGRGGNGGGLEVQASREAAQRKDADAGTSAAPQSKLGADSAPEHAGSAEHGTRTPSLLAPEMLAEQASARAESLRERLVARILRLVRRGEETRAGMRRELQRAAADAEEQSRVKQAALHSLEEQVRGLEARLQVMAGEMREREEQLAAGAARLEALQADRNQVEGLKAAAEARWGAAEVELGAMRETVKSSAGLAASLEQELVDVRAAVDSQRQRFGERLQGLATQLAAAIRRKDTAVEEQQKREADERQLREDEFLNLQALVAQEQEHGKALQRQLRECQDRLEAALATVVDVERARLGCQRECDARVCLLEKQVRCVLE